MPPTVSAGRVMQGVTSNTPLPPSVEAAYYRKCIELKRRIGEIEESNDAIRTRKARVERSILKLRLERAFLLEQIEKRMEENVDESDRSDSPPPTPQDKPLRTRRTHRKATPPPSNSASLAAAPTSPSAHPYPTGAQTSPDPRLATPYGASGGPAASSPLNGAYAQSAGGALVSPSRVASGTLPALAPQGQPGYAGYEGGRGENGDEEGRDPRDTVMADGSPANPGFGGGFTAVNR